MFARARIANVVSSSLLSRVARRPPRRDAGATSSGGAMAREASWSDGPDGARRRTPPDAPHGPVVAYYVEADKELPQKEEEQVRGLAYCSRVCRFRRTLLW